MSRTSLPIAAALAAAALLASACARRPAPRVDAHLLAGFAPGRSPDEGAYDDLFRYFLAGFEANRSPLGARAFFPGLPSGRGARVDGLEGFSRSAPLWGAWVSSGRPRVVALPGSGSIDLAEEFRRGLLAGTDRASAEYWGDIGERDQRIVEASDVALSLWLFRDTVWTGLSRPQRDRVVSWLRQVRRKGVWDNNWHLFPVLVDAVLRALGQEGDPAAAGHWRRFKSFHRGDGWFSDGPGQVFDYYAAWGIHYALAWLQRIDPSWDPGFVAGARAKFLGTYRYLIGPAGLPILGRSVCYRMAAPAPLVLGQGTGPDAVSPAEARRALDAVWSWFIARGALRDGNVTQGYCGADARILDDYLGPASCLWSARSLVAAFSLAPDAPFWRSPAGTLPVERESYRLDLAPTGWRVEGDRRTGTIVIENLRNAGAQDAPLDEYGLLRRTGAALLGRPLRPDNRKAKYGRRLYRSDEPFCGCRVTR